jgi:hypothetical protein
LSNCGPLDVGARLSSGRFYLRTVAYRRIE